MVFTLLPYFYGLYGKLYLLGVFAVHVLLLYVLYVLYAAGEGPFRWSSGRLLKVGMYSRAFPAAVVAGEWMRSFEFSDMRADIILLLEDDGHENNGCENVSRIPRSAQLYLC